MATTIVHRHIHKMRGSRYDPALLAKYGGVPKPPSQKAVLLSSFVASFTGISICAALTYNEPTLLANGIPLMTGAFGATAVLIYGAIDAPLSQPRNVFFGHLFSAIIGVSLFKLFDLLPAATFATLHWLLCALSVSISLFFMQLTHTVHPPASATALIAVTGGPAIYDLGYRYVLYPVLVGICIMLFVALLFNNVARRYPTHWWKPKSRKVMILDQDMATTVAQIVPSAEANDDCGSLDDCESTAPVSIRGDSDSNHEVDLPDQHPVTARKVERDLETGSARIQIHEDHVNTIASSSPGQQHHHLHKSRSRNNADSTSPQIGIYWPGDQNIQLTDGEELVDRGVAEANREQRLNDAVELQMLNQRIRLLERALTAAGLPVPGK